MQPTPEAITSFIADWKRSVMDEENCETLQDLIELGMCSDLATLVWEEFEGVEIRHLENDGVVHFWIEFQGRHYDMQNPEGVSDWRKLDYFDGVPERYLQYVR